MRHLILAAAILGAFATAPAVAAPIVPQTALTAILQQDASVEPAQYRAGRREAIRRQEFRRRQAIRRQQFNRRQAYRRGYY